MTVVMQNSLLQLHGVWYELYRISDSTGTGGAEIGFEEETNEEYYSIDAHYCVKFKDKWIPTSRIFIFQMKNFRQGIYSTVYLDYNYMVKIYKINYDKCILMCGYKMDNTEDYTARLIFKAQSIPRSEVVAKYADFLAFFPNEELKAVESCRSTMCKQSSFLLTLCLLLVILNNATKFFNVLIL